jgi:predicted DNA-binding protein
LHDKDKEKIMSFRVPVVVKETIVDFCNRNDKKQSEVFREAITSYVRYINYVEAEKV